VSGADDQDATHVDSSRQWEHRRSRIKALDDKFRWKLNELGVRRTKLHRDTDPTISYSYIEYDSVFLRARFTNDS